MAYTGNEVFVIAEVNTMSGEWSVHEKAYTTKSAAERTLDSLGENIIGFVCPVQLVFTRSGE